MALLFESQPDRDTFAPPRPASDGSWRTIFDGDPARIVILDPSGSIAEVNRAWRQHSGPDNAGVAWRGTNYFDHLVRDGASVALCIAQGISEVLDGVRDEFTVDYARRESPAGRWTTLRVYPWTRDGERWAICRHDDATELGTAQEQASLMTSVVGDVGAAVVICDLAHRVVHWNESATLLYGYSAEQARSMRIEHLIAPCGTTAELGIEPLDDCGRARGCAVHRRLDGSLVNVDYRVRLLPDRDGGPGFISLLLSAADCGE